MNSKYRKKGVITTLLLIVFLCVLLCVMVIFCGVFYDTCLRKWPAEQNLPKTAQNIHAKVYGGFNLFVPDFIYTLKARITKEEFDEYHKKMGFIEPPENIKKSLFWNVVGAKPWWNPTTDKENTYCDPNFFDKHDDRRMMKYENGYLYFMHSEL